MKFNTAVADEAPRLDEIAGFGPILIDRIAKRWGMLLDHTELRHNPYLLCGVRGVGFKKADQVARALGIAPDSPFRIEAAAEYVLGQAEQSGHTAEPEWRFKKALGQELGAPPQSQISVPAGGDVVFSGGLWSRSRTLEAERLVARRVIEMASDPADCDLDFADDGLKPDQLAALQRIGRSRIALITGPPGTGKTRLISALIDRHGYAELCAPTGKAAKRIEQLTHHEAQTVHRLLGVVREGSRNYYKLPAPFSHGFRFAHHRGNPIDAELVIVDEASMFDIRLAADLFNALSSHTRLLLIGDTFQLPSVGPGALLRDLVKSGAVPHLELTELKRQEADLLIARNCRSIRYEKRVTVDNAATSDFFFIEINDPAKIAEVTVELVTKGLPSGERLDPMRDIMTLPARRKYGMTCADNLNSMLRKVLNPTARGALAVGDRVVQLHNDYELDIMNGDIGVIVGTDPEHVTVAFEVPERVVEIPRSEVDLMHAWALTVHKAQGSEWPWCIVPIHHEQGDFVVSAQHFYTAISRARSGCVVVGPRRWLEHVAANHRDDKRSTRLAGMLARGW